MLATQHHVYYVKTTEGYEVVEETAVLIEVEEDFDWEGTWISETHEIYYS